VIVPYQISWLGLVALVAWGPFVLLSFARLSPISACLLAILGGDLLLPAGGAGFSISGLPDLSASRIATLSALAGCVVFHRGRLLRVITRPWFLLLVALFGVSALATALTNRDVAVQGIRTFAALTPYDGLSMWISHLLDYAIPFLLGAALFRRKQDLLLLHRWVVLAALLYTLPILYELRMSPQLHNMVYGYFPHSFIQSIRGGGYRPVVFLGHGLAVAMFLATGVLLAAGLWRVGATLWRGIPAWTAAVYLLVILLLCKSMAPAVYAITGALLLLLSPLRLRMTSIAVLTSLAIAYPVLRTAGWIPTDAMVEAAASVSQERADSLAFRFANEEILLARAHERIRFGWGGFGRNRVFGDYGDLTVTDGMWIIVVGLSGIVGFGVLFGQFGVVIANAIRTAGRLRSPETRILFSSLTLLIAVRLVDCIPNAGFGSFLFLLVGATTGLCTGLPAEERARRRIRRRDALGTRLEQPAPLENPMPTSGPAPG
jgi:hypothetical protein